MSKTILSPKDYLTLLNKLGIQPNFYCSEAYLTVSKAVISHDGYWATAEADGWMLFPPVPLLRECVPVMDGGLRKVPYGMPLGNVWSDFSNYAPMNWGYEPEFLDYEYIYRPVDFQYMNGGRWETFRKNSRKWVQRNDNFHWLSRGCTIDARIDLLKKWLETRTDEIHDGDMMTQYLVDDTLPLCFKNYLWKDSQLVAINISDCSYGVNNFRWNITDPEEPYLNEYTRYHFLTSASTFVNDGGCLGKESLEKFKDKLNPIIKRAVHSWRCYN